MDYRVELFRREIRKIEEEKQLAMTLVIEHCHPSQLGVLPPSPKVLLQKAVLLGLL